VREEALGQPAGVLDPEPVLRRTFLPSPRRYVPSDHHQANVVDVDHRRPWPTPG